MFPPNVCRCSDLLLEKQGRANFNQGPQKIYCNHQGSYVRKKEGGGNFPDSILRYGLLG